MITLIIMIQNEREEQILKAAFEQRGVKVIRSKPSYQNYVMILQYMPDIVFIELPHICTEQLAFAKRLRAYKRTKTIPIAGYGEKVDEMVKNGVSGSGFTLYIERPLKFSTLLKLFGQLLKSQGKSFSTPPQNTDMEKDLDLILNSDGPPMQKVEAMACHISALLAFPFSVAKVLQISQNEKSGAANLAQAIVSDPSITTHILKVANSVFFASASHRITSIKDAIVRIGFTETRKIVMGMHVMQLFKKENKNSGFDRVDFWYHSLIVGLISERIAKQMGDVNVETAFLAGLLHDLGIILLDEYLSPVFERALEMTASAGGHFIDVQTELFNVNHNDLIASLFPLWKLPADITDAITLQFKLETIGATIDTQGKKLAVCVAIGNLIAKSVHIGRECDEYVYPISDTCLKFAKLKAGITKKIIANFNDDLSMYQNFLGLEVRTFTCEIAGIEEPGNLTIALFVTQQSNFIPLEVHLRNIGFKLLYLKSLAQKDVQYDCVIIYDITGQMNFSNEKSSQSEESTDVQNLNELSNCIFVGQNDDPPDGLPEKFHYLSSGFDLRILDVLIGNMLVKENLSGVDSETDSGDKPPE
ncbi:MAG TPA: HDOD domain-containing protein [Chitinispirillaceae bacterium]|nr:HDOD domain-containing protein [Chitinispirillaceae bacterium]